MSTTVFTSVLIQLCNKQVNGIDMVQITTLRTTLASSP